MPIRWPSPTSNTITQPPSLLPWVLWSLCVRISLCSPRIEGGCVNGCICSSFCDSCTAAQRMDHARHYYRVFTDISCLFPAAVLLDYHLGDQNQSRTVLFVWFMVCL